MNRSETNGEHVSVLLEKLRLTLESLGLSGLEYWPAAEKPAPAAKTEPAGPRIEKAAPRALVGDRQSEETLSFPSAAEAPATPGTRKTAPPSALPEADRARSEEAAQGLRAVRAEIGDCTRCRLHKGRNKLVFGDGSPSASVVFVGEGPGMEEDRQGLPFVGRAGKLLDKMLRAAGLERKQVYICNIVKCRPPNNRTPQAEEVETCAPFLRKQLQAIQPRLIVALGAPAAQTLLDNKTPIGKLRGRIHFYRGIPLIATYHPAYLLRNSSSKAASWEDLKKMLEFLRDTGGDE
jgi:DNA polymerase